jgi:pilus assembly protein Flp/PilA
MENPMRALYVKTLLAFYPRKLAKDETGVTAIEYGLIAALVAVVCITVWSTLGTNLSKTFSTVANSL